MMRVIRQGKPLFAILLIAFGMLGICAAGFGYSPWFGMSGVAFVWCGGMSLVWGSHK